MGHSLWDTSTRRTPSLLPPSPLTPDVIPPTADPEYSLYSYIL